eukprot:303281-Lingulodinium_polyedra.AAC.1
MGGNCGRHGAIPPGSRARNGPTLGPGTGSTPGEQPWRTKTSWNLWQTEGHAALSLLALGANRPWGST